MPAEWYVPYGRNDGLTVKGTKKLNRFKVTWSSTALQTHKRFLKKKKRKN